MNYASFLDQKGQLLAEIGEEKAALELVFRERKGWTYTDFILKQTESVSEADKVLIEEIVAQLSQHVPAQYLLGKVDFYGLEFAVDDRVLIPRPETEELVDLILAENSRAGLQVLDIGTGSGAIAISLAKKCLAWQVTAVDISADALAVAQENAQKHQVAIKFIQSDLFEQVTDRFDLIVSNPPYIAEEDKDEVGLNVLHSEPHLALFAPENGLAIYRKIAEQARDFLQPDGKIYLEIGYKQGEAVQKLFAQAFPEKSVRVLQDSFGQDRMVVIA